VLAPPSQRTPMLVAVVGHVAIACSTERLCRLAEILGMEVDDVVVLDPVRGGVAVEVVPHGACDAAGTDVPRAEVQRGELVEHAGDDRIRADDRLQGLDLVRERQMGQSVRVPVDHAMSVAAGGG
jgi:hypothetical protein